MARKPKVLVLSTDSKTRKLTPKRLRVSIACLLCRKKKRRCDGNQPCLHCNQNNLKCEYPNTINPTPSQSTSHSNLNSDTTSPQTNNNTPPLNTIITISTHSTTNIPLFKKEQGNFTLFDNIIHNKHIEQSLDKEYLPETIPNSPILKSNDTIDYKRIVKTLFTKDNLQNIINNNINTTKNNDDDDDNNNKNDINEFLITLIDRNTNKDGYLNLNEIRMGNPSILPPRDIALKLILKTWNFACVLFRFYHRPTIIKILDSLYENKGYPRTLNEIRAEALIYAVLAVGALFSKDDHLDNNNNSTTNSKRDYYGDEGYKYFLKSKTLIDFADVSDIYSIQTLFMLTLFLQCSANLKSCYHYIGIALRSAIKEGLYKSSSLIGPTPIEDETKKRLFWSIYKVDIYMNCILGLPSSMNEDKVDQELPLDVDDERITANGIIESQDKTAFLKISSCGMNNEHTKLLLVMSRIYEYTSQLTLSKILHRTELQRRINDLELQLNMWYEQLPAALKPTYKMASIDEKNYYLKPQKLLQLDFLLTKLTLYKPFFHFITLNVNDYPNLEFQIRMSTNCIKISIEIIRLSYDMINMDLLNGTYWYSIHTIYYSFACLTIYKYQLRERSNVQDERLNEIENVCDLGYKILIELQKYSRAGKRILKVLELIFKQFNDKFLELNLQLISNLQNFKNSKSKTQLYENNLTSTTGNYFNMNSAVVGTSPTLEQPSQQQQNHYNNNISPGNIHINNQIGMNTELHNNLITNPDDNTDLIFNSQNFLNKLLEELEMDI